MSTVTDADRALARALCDYNFGADTPVDDYEAELIARHRETAEARARLEGMEIMQEAAARAVEGEHLEDPQTADDDAYGAALIHAAEGIRNLDPAAILKAHTRAKAMDELAEADAELLDDIAPAPPVG